MKPIVITNVSQDKYNFLLNKLRQNKEILVTGNTIEFHGVKLQFEYKDNTLTLTVLQKPLLVTQGHIQEIVNEELADYVEPKPAANAPAVVPAKVG